MSDKKKAGEQTRREVLGDSHVDRSKENASSFNSRFQELITEGAWGHVWSDETLSRRERSLITIALLAALGNDEELAMHINACHNTGASQEDIREALMHVAIYAGVPRANHAIRIAQEVFDKSGKSG
ncbi:MAG: 4-carboxymuconolactone decarboxylase [Pseudomonadota bacterium]